MNRSKKTLTYIRHGESLSNAGAITMPHNAIPLSDTGHQQAAHLARLMDVQPSMVLVSSMIRTHETAAPYCRLHSVIPQIHADLDEFSVIDPVLIEGLDGAQRKPFVKAFWDDPQPGRRLGDQADTFAEFDARVCTFMNSMGSLPDSTVIFGHGIWFGLMMWKLLGYSAHDAEGMKAFRRFQLGFPMPNCAVFTLTHDAGSNWSVQANVDLMRSMAGIQEQKI